MARKVRSGLEELGMDPEEWAVYLHHLLGVKQETERLSVLTPEAIRARTVDALRQMGLRGSRQRPIVFVCEDLQWIDRTSEECLDAVLETTTGASVLSLFTYRPGYRPPWMNRSYATQLALQPLSRGDSQRIVEGLLATRGSALAPAILSKAEGNPFFLEELCRTVAEQPDAASAIAVPDTVQEALRARIDRLPEDVKDALRLASVIGREVPLRLLQTVWRGPGDIEHHLRELTRLEFLYEQTRVAESIYVFKHALTQEVVYESLPVAQRHALHAATARALERLYEGRLEDADDRLAYHYARTDQSDRAVECLSRVAQKAARGHAHAEALGALEEALAHVERLPAEARDQRRLRLVLRKASSLIHLGRFREVLSVLLHWKASVDRLDDAALSAYYHFLLARTHLFVGDQLRAIQSAERAIADAARSGDTTTLGKAHYVLAQEAPLSGRSAEGIRHALEALACLERAGRAWWVGQAHWAVGLNHALLGELDAALEAETRARLIGETVGNKQLQASALCATGIVQAALGHTEAGIEACEGSVAVAPDPLTSAVALGWLGFAFVEHGAAARAIPPLEASAQQHRVFHFPQFQGWFTAFLAGRLSPGRPAGACPRHRAGGARGQPGGRILLRRRPGTARAGPDPARGRDAGRGHGHAPGGRGDLRGDPGPLRHGAGVAGPRRRRERRGRSRGGGQPLGAGASAPGRAPRASLGGAGGTPRQQPRRRLTGRDRLARPIRYGPRAPGGLAGRAGARA
jgi:tetratricopeptide (TPR) repeat protein